MKKLIIVLSMLLAVSTSYSQLVTEKNLGSYGFGEKKIKKAPKRVYVNKFIVNYQVLSSGAQTSTTGKTRAEMAVALEGASPEIMQDITDKSYNRMVEKLTSAGFEVVDVEEAATAEMFSEWTRRSGGSPSMDQLMGFVSTAPTGFDYFVKRVTKKGKEKKTFFDTTPKLSKQLGDIPVLEAAINFQFVVIEGNSFINEASKLKGTINYEIPPSAIAQSAEGILGGGTVKTSPTVARVVWKGGAAGAGALSMFSFTPKKSIDVPGVVESKKLKEYVSPSYNYNNNPYSPIVFSTKKELNVSHVVKADTEAFKTQTEKALNEYLDFLVDDFIAKSNG